MSKVRGDIMEINKKEIKVRGVNIKYQKAIVLIIVLIFLTILFMILLLALRGYNSNLGAQSFQKNYILVNVAKSAFNKTLAELYLNPSYSGENFSPLNNVNVSIMVTPIPNRNVRGLRNVSITVSRGNNRVFLKSVVKVWEWRLNDFLFFATDSISVGVNSNAGFFGTDDPNIMPKVVSLNTLNWDVNKQNNSIQASSLDLLGIIRNKALSLVWARSITGSGAADAVIYSNSLSSTIRNKVNNNNDKIISNTPPPEYLRDYVDPFPTDFYSGNSSRSIDNEVLSPNKVYTSDNSRYYLLNKTGKLLFIRKF
jgi:hypothetical protein